MVADNVNLEACRPQSDGCCVGIQRASCSLIHVGGVSDVPQQRGHLPGLVAAK
jgi:hypothetical protein